jgi:hypothetical protein
VTKRHPDLLFDPDTDVDPDPDIIRFPLSFSFRHVALQDGELASLFCQRGFGIPELR